METTPTYSDTDHEKSPQELNSQGGLWQMYLHRLRFWWSDRRYLFRLIQPWLSTVVRLGLAVVFMVAGGGKVDDLPAFGRAVNAYDVMPIDLGRVVGATLPFIEIAIGLLLLIGFATRISAAISGLLFAVFITGIAQAWARGLNIDCGCFSEGGYVAANQTQYPWEITRDLGLFALTAFMVFFPRSKYSLDARLAGPEEIE